MKEYRVVDKLSNILAEGDLTKLILYTVFIRTNNPKACVFIVDCEEGETITDDELFTHLQPIIESVEVI